MDIYLEANQSQFPQQEEISSQVPPTSKSNPAKNIAKIETKNAKKEISNLNVFKNRNKSPTTPNREKSKSIEPRYSFNPNYFEEREKTKDSKQPKERVKSEQINSQIAKIIQKESPKITELTNLELTKIPINLSENGLPKNKETKATQDQTYDNDRGRTSSTYTYIKPGKVTDHELSTEVKIRNKQVSTPHEPIINTKIRANEFSTAEAATETLDGLELDDTHFSKGQKKTTQKQLEVKKSSNVSFGVNHKRPSDNSAKVQAGPKMRSDGITQSVNSNVQKSQNMSSRITHNRLIEDGQPNLQMSIKTSRISRENSPENLRQTVESPGESFQNRIYKNPRNNSQIIKKESNVFYQVDNPQLSEVNKSGPVSVRPSSRSNRRVYLTPQLRQHIADKHSHCGHSQMPKSAKFEGNSSAVDSMIQTAKIGRGKIEENELNEKFSVRLSKEQFCYFCHEHMHPQCYKKHFNKDK